MKHVMFLNTKLQIQYLLLYNQSDSVYVEYEVEKIMDDGCCLKSEVV